MPFFVISDGVLHAKYTSAPTLPPGALVEEVDQETYDTAQVGFIQDGAGGYRMRRWYDDEKYPTVALLKPYIFNEWKKDKYEALSNRFNEKFTPTEVAGFAQARAAADAYLAATNPATEIPTHYYERISKEAMRAGKTGTAVAEGIVDKNDDYVSGSGELSGFRGAIETIVTDFAKGVGETEQQAKQRLVELVEDEYASTSSALDAVFGVV